MNELGIGKPKDLPRGKSEFEIDWFKWLLDFKGKKRKGKSTLKKWTCGCQNARIGKKDFYAQCTKSECGQVFVIADTGVVFEKRK